MRQAAFHSPLISGLPIGGVTPMSTTARLEDLKRDLARLERKRTGSPRQGRTVAEEGRGREAAHPGQIPSRGWMDVLWRAWGEVGEANLFLIAGGVTYALILALFPGLAALVSLYGLVFDPSQIETQVGALSGVLPAQTQELLSQQLHSLVEASGGALGIGALVGVLLALWSASRGMSGIITALNIAYEEKERRGFFKLGARSHIGSLGRGHHRHCANRRAAGGHAIPCHRRRNKVAAVVGAMALVGRPHDVRARGALSLRTRPGQAAMAVGFIGRDRRDRPVDHRLDRVQGVRGQL